MILYFKFIFIYEQLSHPDIEVCEAERLKAWE